MIRVSKTKINPYGLRIITRKPNTDYVCRKFKRTGVNKAIHNQFLDSKLNEKEAAIKRGIKSALFIIDCERDEDADINNTADEEARIVMCCIFEELQRV